MCMFHSSSSSSLDSTRTETGGSGLGEMIQISGKLWLKDFSSRFTHNNTVCMGSGAERGA